MTKSGIVTIVLLSLRITVANNAVAASKCGLNKGSVASGTMTVYIRPVSSPSATLLVLMP
jgi:hypothetical protein